MSARAETNPPGSVLTGETTFYAYVGPGESLDVEFEKFRNFGGGGSDTRFIVTAPDGVVVRDCTVLRTHPVGQSCAATGLTGAEGVWKIHALPLNGQAANWPEMGTSHFDWNITINAGGAPISGRVWTDKYRAYDIDSTV